MSLQQTNTFVTRTRSLRAPPKPALTAPQPAPQHVLATTATATATPSTQIPSSTSNVALFLTNLRLLDLDLEPDWPGITLATFSAKDAAGGQKKRIQCVEWALYQLFTLWDYNETQSKIRPFYPPLDQVQSVNLRAALLRALDQAKKNGVLGRDVLIRKTMLDECKGERLEEVLGVFSSAVLKKLVAERALNSGPEYRPTISESLSLESWGYSGDRTNLNALLLAHKGSLSSSLRKKGTACAKYREFEELLTLKERGIAQRKEQVKIETEKNVAEASEKKKKDVYRAIRTNWTGNDQWIDSLLFNDTQSRKGGVLGSDFDDVWAGVQEGRIADLEDQNVGLLELLDDRVRLQKARLEKWNNFRNKMFGNLPPMPSIEAGKKDKPKGVDLGFTAHQKLSLDQIGAKGARDPVPLNAPPPEYAKILSSMKTELDAIGKPKIANFSNIIGASKRAERAGTTSHLEEPLPTADPISDLSEWEDEPVEEAPPIEKPIKPSAGPRYRLAPPKGSLESRGRTLKKESSIEEPRYEHKRAMPTLSPELEVSEQTPTYPPQISTRPLVCSHGSTKSDTMTPTSAPRSVAPRGASPTQISHPSKAVDPMPSPERPVSPTQAMADEILASITNASPSPVKKPRYALSLAERTRMSMSRTKSFDKEDDMLPQVVISPNKPSHAQSSSVDAIDSMVERGEEYEDLMARTQRSMAGFEAARQKAQLERRRSERKSKMPQKKDNYFPRLEEDACDTSIAEELIEAGQEDYEAVFRSRPRIQTSPLPSPTKTWGK
ncbi:hypothetical protein AAE478_001507 [Parahypoxylon ruwenzoriense]